MQFFSSASLWISVVENSSFLIADTWQLTRRSKKDNLNYFSHLKITSSAPSTFTSIIRLLNVSKSSRNFFLSIARLNHFLNTDTRRKAARTQGKIPAYFACNAIIYQVIERVIQVSGNELHLQLNKFLELQKDLFGLLNNKICKNLFCFPYLH